jgi:hypothetical protein
MGQILSRDEQWRYYEAAQKEIAKWTDAMWKVNDAENKWLMTLSSSAFGLSFVFINNIIPLATAVWKLALLISWASFALCFVSEIISMWTSGRAFRNRIDKENADLKLRYNGAAPAESKKDIYVSVLRITAHIARFSFIGGLIWMFLFIACNILK